VEEGLILALAPTPAHYARYRRWLQNNFIQLRGWRWCPNPHCDRVVAPTADADPIASAAVACDCLTQWCLGCGGDAHWPSSCDFARRYESFDVVRMMRSADDGTAGAAGLASAASAPVNVARTKVSLSLEVKPCPGCNTPWHRDEGCNHMLCRNCGAHWCWVCLSEDWLHMRTRCVPPLIGTVQQMLQSAPGVQLEMNKRGELVAVITDWMSAVADHGLQVPKWLQREAVHFRAARRLLALQRLLDTAPLPAPVPTLGAAAASASTTDSSSSPEQLQLAALLFELEVQPSQRRSLQSLLAFVRQCHDLLRGCCMHLSAGGERVWSRSTGGANSKGEGSAARLVETLGQLDYFTRALDDTLLSAAAPATAAGRAPRALRSLARMRDADRPSMAKAAVALRTAVAAFFRGEEAAHVRALEGKLWRRMAKIGDATPTDKSR